MCLQDRYGNVAGQDMTGSVQTEIVAGPPGAATDVSGELPCLVGGGKRTFPLVNAQCQLTVRTTRRSPNSLVNVLIVYL